MPLGLSDPGLGLSIDGITSCDQAEALLYVDEHHELVIKSIGQAHVVIERSGRKNVLQPEHPICILVKDTIIIGSVDTHTFNIRHIYSTCKKTTQSNRMSKMAMIACSASMMICPACNHPTPNNATQIRESPETQACELTEEDIRLMIPHTSKGVSEEIKLHPDDFVDEMKSSVEE